MSLGHRTKEALEFGAFVLCFFALFGFVFYSTEAESSRAIIGEGGLARLNWRCASPSEAGHQELSDSFCDLHLDQVFSVGVSSAYIPAEQVDSRKGESAEFGIFLLELHTELDGDVSWGLEKGVAGGDRFITSIEFVSNWLDLTLRTQDSRQRSWSTWRCRVAKDPKEEILSWEEELMGAVTKVPGMPPEAFAQNGSRVVLTDVRFCLFPHWNWKHETKATVSTVEGVLCYSQPPLGDCGTFDVLRYHPKVFPWVAERLRKPGLEGKSYQVRCEQVPEAILGICGMSNDKYAVSLIRKSDHIPLTYLLASVTMVETGVREWAVVRWDFRARPKKGGAKI